MILSMRRMRLLATGLALAAGFALAGCEGDYDASNGRSLAPIPQKTLTLMDDLGTTASAPIIFRAYKKEAEFEVWKKKSDGQYALLKTYPMCRWSGQLGPKKREGDRQVPEGFYAISPGQMNPNSNYYLSFNVGYPNAYDRAWDRGGGSIMVHGICSSAGCFSMTDEQIGEIYAIAREAFNGGQRQIQFQSYPFRMTTDNLAKFRYDPNIAFWKELKNGSDHFEVTKAEVPVTVCDRRYVFGAKSEGGCSRLIRDEGVESEVAAKSSKDAAEVAALVGKGVKPVRAGLRRRRPKRRLRRQVSKSAAPTRWSRGRAKSSSTARASRCRRSSKSRAPTPRRRRPPARPARSPPRRPRPPWLRRRRPRARAALLDGGKRLMSSLFKSGETPPAVQVIEPNSPVPADAPLPPRRAASLNAPLREAALHDNHKRDDANTAE